MCPALELCINPFVFFLPFHPTFCDFFRLTFLCFFFCSFVVGAGGVSEDMICNLLAVLYEVRGTLGKEKNNQMLSEKKQKSLQKQVFEVRIPKLLPLQVSTSSVNRNTHARCFSSPFTLQLREESSKLKYQILHLKRNFRK